MLFTQSPSPALPATDDPGRPKLGYSSRAVGGTVYVDKSEAWASRGESMVRKVGADRFSAQ
jgi:hypothetical protein